LRLRKKATAGPSTSLRMTELEKIEISHPRVSDWPRR
jgi:hypothetical protein